MKIKTLDFIVNFKYFKEFIIHLKSKSFLHNFNSIKISNLEFIPKFFINSINIQLFKFLVIDLFHIDLNSYFYYQLKIS